MLQLIKTVLAICVISISNWCQAQSPNNGVWRAELQYDSINVPFTFNWKMDEEDTVFTLINGSNHKTLHDIRITKDSLIVKLKPFDAALKFSYTTDVMTGEWVKYYRNSHIEITARYNQPRFAVDDKKIDVIANRWEVQLTPPFGLSYQGVGLWHQNGSEITGTIMTDVSDLRYFEGVVTSDSIKLSSFDGAHGFMFVGKQEQGAWHGSLYFDESYKENWVAQPNSDVELKDPWKIIKIKPGEHRPFFDILSAGSSSLEIDESKYFDKVLVIQLFGTWCPNSLDETKFLIDWYRNHQDLPTEILGISYEANFSEAYGLKRLEEYKEYLDIPYELKLGGRLSKGEAALAFPFMDKIQAFPTLVILDKMGYVRYVHSYFNGPATGKYYKQFVDDFNEIIKQLVNE